jgi:hypothetical protein
VYLRGLAAAAAVASISACLPARADVDVRIDKSEQRMTVKVDGHERYSWPVSTGRAGYGTPSGHYRPQWMARKYFSRKYYDSPMPYSIFFHGGFAIHGTNEISRLGGPASHGCVRLTPGHAAKLFALVKEEGMHNTRIAVTGSNPSSASRVSRHSRHAADEDAPRWRHRLGRDSDAVRRAYYEAYRARGYYHMPYAYTPYYVRSWQYGDDD